MPGKKTGCSSDKGCLSVIVERYWRTEQLVVDGLHPPGQWGGVAVEAAAEINFHSTAPEVPPEAPTAM